MGWSFRKSVNFGPVRVNLSRRGVGYSVGMGGFRTGVRAGGRRYSRITIPGTGISYQTTGGGGTPAGGGCLVFIGLVSGIFVLLR